MHVLAGAFETNRVEWTASEETASSESGDVEELAEVNARLNGHLAVLEDKFEGIFVAEALDEQFLGTLEAI